MDTLVLIWSARRAGKWQGKGFLAEPGLSEPVETSPAVASYVTG
jgi:hypothetical protein